MGIRFKGVVKDIYTFHTLIEGGMGSSLSLTSENCNDRHLLYKGKFVILELDEEIEKWILIEGDVYG